MQRVINYGKHAANGGNRKINEVTLTLEIKKGRQTETLVWL